MFSKKKYSQSNRGRAAGQEKGEWLYAEKDQKKKKEKRQKKKSILFLIVCENGDLVFK